MNFFYSFNLSFSSEPSIEKLSEHNYNGIINTNVINDQTIAIICSDTSRELNNLTEELQHSDLSTRRKTSIQESNTCQSNSDNSQVNVLDKENLKDDVAEVLNNHKNSYQFDEAMRTNALTYYHDTFIDKNNDRTDNTDQDLETSPYYTHLSQDLENNLINLTRSAYDGYSSEAQSDISDTVDGGHFKGSTDDNGEVGGMSAFMLQSVDLRGKTSSISI